MLKQMKKYIIILCISLFVLTSCNKWLDVKPLSEVEQSTLLQTETGFQEALNGVYATCNTSQTYGELTCGFLDYLAGNYSQNSLSGLSNTVYKPFFTYDYTHKDAISKFGEIWQSMYKSIALCNVILGNIDAKKNIFSGNNYAVIKGEALALRGYLHFDLLRLYAPSFASSPDAVAIPYITEFSLKGAPRSKVSEVLTKIIADLNAAKLLLKDSDPILSSTYVVGYPSNTKDAANTKYTNENTGKNLFFNNRRDRMNYYAVCGTLARVCLYKQDKATALANALEVINAKNTVNGVVVDKFPWATKERITTSDPELKDRIFYTELIFGWYAPALKEDMSTKKFENSDQGMFTSLSYFNSAFETGSGGPGGTDMRYANLYNTVSNPSGDMMLTYKYHQDVSSNMYDLRLPAIRLSEMYYIAAESAFDTDQVQAWAYFNKVRFQRGITATLSGTDKNLFLSELVKEYRKEFFAEGQLFYLFKRLNRSIAGINGSLTPASNKVFVLPIPDAELQYGSTVTQ
jgi:starch-binding outer membrane protein, SusD/RagB family